MSVTMSARPLKVICLSTFQPSWMILPAVRAASIITSIAGRPAEVTGKEYFGVSAISSLSVLWLFAPPHYTRQVARMRRGRRGRSDHARRYQETELMPAVKVRAVPPNVTVASRLIFIQ